MIVHVGNLDLASQESLLSHATEAVLCFARALSLLLCALILGILKFPAHTSDLHLNVSIFPIISKFNCNYWNWVVDNMHKFR